MSIVIEQPNTVPHDKCFTAGFKCVGTVCKTKVTKILCCGGCFGTESKKVYSNDKSGYFDYLQLEGVDTIVYKLCYNGNEITLDGTNYSIIDVNGSNYYICIDWEKVFNAFGVGFYTVKINRTVLGQPVNTVHEYNLCEYDPCETAGTLQIKYWLNGSFKDGRTFCNYEFGLRINGELREVDPLEEIEQFKNKDCEVETISSGIFQRFELETHDITPEQATEIYETLAHADRIEITNYQDYTQPRGALMRENGLNIENIKGKTFYKMSFVEKKQDNFKTLCK